MGSFVQVEYYEDNPDASRLSADVKHLVLCDDNAEYGPAANGEQNKARKSWRKDNSEKTYVLHVWL